MITETIETMPEEIKEIEQIEDGKPMFTISKDLVVVETANLFSNPLSYDYNAMKLFLDNNLETLDSYFNDNDNNYGISAYACGYNGDAQDEFIKGWLDNGVQVS